jgi:hypothetical protein
LRTDLDVVGAVHWKRLSDRTPEHFQENAMASEITVLELEAPRQSNAPCRKMPPVAVQVLDAAGAASAAFAGKTTLISVYSTVATNIDIRATPATGNKFPLPAGVWHDFDVQAGHKIRSF